jgi:hypothetical protein
MKWYSVKKYKPIEYGKYFVYEKQSGYSYVAYLECFTGGSFMFYNNHNEEPLPDITHFMYIPPVEIEE